VTNVTFDPVAFLGLVIAFIALIFSLVNRRRIERATREKVLGELGDPTAYTVVTDGKFFRVRGPFDTFYTIRFRNKTEAEQYARQLAHYNGHVFNQEGWRAAA
jgi:hypothetical protein